MKKCALFCSKGLGDGLIFLVLAHNLKQNGIEVEVFHDFLPQLSSFFLDLNMGPYPSSDELQKKMTSFDLVLINTDDRKINQEAFRIARELKIKTYSFHATTCKKPKKDSYPLPRDRSLVVNLLSFLKQELKLKNLVQENGMRAPLFLNYRKFSNRIVVHPTSTNIERNWPLKKYFKVVKKLQKKGFEIAFILTREERKEYLFLESSGILIPAFKDLEETAAYIYESGFMLGNDSGIGHLASSLKIPTFTIFTSKRKQNFWKPDLFFSEGIAPLSIFPNFKGFKFRERFWKELILPSCVYKKFISFSKGPIQ